MDFQATVLEVILIAGVGAYIGFLVGLKSGAFLAFKNKNRSKKARKSPAARTSKFSTKKKARTALS